MEIDGGDIADAAKKLDRVLAQNGVPREWFTNRRHKQKGEERRRLNSIRHRRRFSHEVSIRSTGTVFVPCNLNASRLSGWENGPACATDTQKKQLDRHSLWISARALQSFLRVGENIWPNRNVDAYHKPMRTAAELWKVMSTKMASLPTATHQEQSSLVSSASIGCVSACIPPSALREHHHLSMSSAAQGFLLCGLQTLRLRAEKIA